MSLAYSSARCQLPSLTVLSFQPEHASVDMKPISGIFSCTSSTSLIDTPKFAYQWRAIWLTCFFTSGSLRIYNHDFYFTLSKKWLWKVPIPLPANQVTGTYCRQWPSTSGDHNRLLEEQVWGQVWESLVDPWVSCPLFGTSSLPGNLGLVRFVRSVPKFLRYVFRTLQRILSNYNWNNFIKIH